MYDIKKKASKKATNVKQENFSNINERKFHAVSINLTGEKKILHVLW